MDFSQYVCDTIHRGPDTALHWLDSKFRKAQADGQIDELTVNPMADLLVSRRVIYKRLITISGASRIQNRQPDFKIFERVRGKSPLKDHEVCNLITEVLHGLDASLGIRPGEVLLDIPRARREESGGLVLVYTDDGHQFLDGLFEISALLQGHKESFELNVKRMRIFLHPRVYAQLESANRVSDAYRACLDALRERYAR